MARTRHQADWSCPLCTLLNAAADDRCAACDNARPPVHQKRKSGAPEPPTAAATVSSRQYVYRPVAGVFFSTPVAPQGASYDYSAWRTEPRLHMNRRCGVRQREATTERDNKQQSGTGGAEQTEAATGRLKDAEEGVEASDAVARSCDAVSQSVKVGKQQKEEDDDDTAMDVEEPCFNLLGLGASVFGAPETDEIVEENCTTDEAKSREESEEVDAEAEDVVEVSSPPRYPGFMPASKVLIEEPVLEEKLASAGLDLSDSDDEEEKLKVLRRRKESESWEDKWVCQICTYLNEQSNMACSSCMCKRFKDTPRLSGTNTGSSSEWACHICTNLNSPDLTECEACMTNKRVDTGPPSISSGRWTCSVCTNSNAARATQCEVCESKREDESKRAAGKGRECPVCTNVNAPGSTRCELCESSLQPEEDRDDQFVDLASSPVRSPARKSRYTFDESDLDNPYADLSQYDAAPNEVVDADSDFLEEISDNEVVMPLTSSRPVKVRANLMEFKHYVCMEDLHDDYGCHINYNKMFAGQRSKKSYADRLAARQAQSRKRKREAARGEILPSSFGGGKKGGKAARGSKKKTAAASRRASAGTKTTKAKRTKKKAAPVRRASAATTYSSGINHYDDNAGADLGEDISTMAWEGLGSAGYR